MLSGLKHYSNVQEKKLYLQASIFHKSSLNRPWYVSGHQTLNPKPCEAEALSSSKYLLHSRLDCLGSVVLGCTASVGEHEIPLSQGHELLVVWGLGLRH